MPRGWHVPGLAPGTPPRGGRPSKGHRISFLVRLGPEAAEALRYLTGENKRSQSEIVTDLLLAAVSANEPPASPGAFLEQ